jgi:type II secretory pathway component PulJ
VTAKDEQQKAIAAAAKRLPHSRDIGGFTLAEMLVATAILVVMVLFVTRLVNHAAVIVTHGTKHMETESHVRPFFDRLAVDIAQMVKRTDVSYYLKNANNAANLNDQLAFFSAVSGYYNDNDSPHYNSQYSVVAYRINANTASPSYNRVERMAKGLPLNAGTIPATPTGVDATPLLFLDAGSTTRIDQVWPAAADPSIESTDPYQKYELICPQAFRLEYYYLTSGSAPALVAYPATWTSPSTINIKDVSAIVVAVAAIDPQSRKLLSDTQINDLAARLPNYTTGGPGTLLGQWQTAVQTDAQVLALPLPVRQGIRFYERYFYLNQ